MSKEISKSPEVLQKEAQIKKLQTQLKKRKSILKGLKTRLKNNKKEIEEVQFKANTRIIGVMERMDEMRKEIAELAKKMKSVKGLSRDDKNALEEMTEAFTQDDLLGEDFQEYQRQKAEHMEGNFDFEDNARAKMRDLFEGLQVKPDEQEQKDIRKVFVKLANKFHPDRARTKKEELEFHEMQQKLNDAYKSGDIQTLLEMERLYLLEEIDLSEAKAYTVDVLQQAIDKIEKELSFIENQISRCRGEIKNLRDSQFGEMLTSIKKANKEGFGIDDQIAEMERMLEMLSKVRDGLKDSIERGEISPLIMDMAMEGPMMGGPLDGIDGDMSPEELQEMLESLLGGKGGNFFDDINEATTNAYKDAKYQPDQTVVIKKAISHHLLRKVKLKGCVGRIIGIDYNENGQLEYEVSLDSVSLQQLPKEIFEKSINIGYDFQDVDVLEKDLAACEPRDSEADSFATYRSLYHQYNWAHLSAAQSERLQKILLADPAKSDNDNWRNHLVNQVKYPFNVLTRGILEGGLPPNEKITVTGAVGMNDDVGIVMSIKMGKQRGTYPLLDLYTKNKKSPVFYLLEDYAEWQQQQIDNKEDEDDFFF